MIPDRRPCTNVKIDNFVVTIGYHPDTGAVCEAFISERGKPGELNDTLARIGTVISKAIQGEDLDDIQLDNILGELDTWTDKLA